MRKNTLQVLTHLILNDMVKVKGNISEMATCIMDADERIAALAKQFFHELAKKVIPTVSSRYKIQFQMCNPHDFITSQNYFCRAMQYII